MIDRIAAMVHRIAQYRPEFAREGVRDYGLALDQAGIAVTGFLPGVPAVDQNDVAATPLEVQRHAHSDHSRSENDDVCAAAHPAHLQLRGVVPLISPHYFRPTRAALPTRLCNQA